MLFLIIHLFAVMLKNRLKKSKDSCKVLPYSLFKEFSLRFNISHALIWTYLEWQWKKGQGEDRAQMKCTVNHAIRGVTDEIKDLAVNELFCFRCSGETSPCDLQSWQTRKKESAIFHSFVSMAQEQTQFFVGQLICSSDTPVHPNLRQW